MKEDVEDLEWKIKLDCYLKNLKDEKCKYERFLLEDISEKIMCHKDEYMLTEYSHIVEYFIAIYQRITILHVHQTPIGWLVICVSFRKIRYIRVIKKFLFQMQEKFHLIENG